MVMQSIDLSVILNDVHVPYQDERAVNVTLELIEYVKPSTVFLNGDIIDFYQMSRFDRNPNRVLELQADLDRLHDFLAAVRRAAPQANICYLEGNHEARLQRYLWNHPEIANLRALQAEQLFRLAEHGVKWIPQNQTHLHHGFIVTHGTVVRQASGASAKGQLERYLQSGISGHTHRQGMYRLTTFAGDFVWHENGCLCSLEPEYIVGRPNWQQCIAIGQFVADGDRFQISQVNIVNGRALYDGMLFG